MEGGGMGRGSDLSCVEAGSVPVSRCAAGTGTRLPRCPFFRRFAGKLEWQGRGGGWVGRLRAVPVRHKLTLRVTRAEGRIPARSRANGLRTPQVQSGDIHDGGPPCP